MDHHLNVWRKAQVLKFIFSSLPLLPPQPPVLLCCRCLSETWCTCRCKTAHEVSPVHFSSLHFWIACRKVRRLNCTLARISLPSCECNFNFEFLKVFSSDPWCIMLSFDVHMLWWILARVSGCAIAAGYKCGGTFCLYHEGGGSLFSKTGTQQTVGL
jgi:hypothetical protein